MLDLEHAATLAANPLRPPVRPAPGLDVRYATPSESYRERVRRVQKAIEAAFFSGPPAEHTALREVYDGVVHRIHFALRPSSLQAEEEPLEARVAQHLANDGEYDGEEKELYSQSINNGAGGKYMVREGHGAMTWVLGVDVASGEQLVDRYEGMWKNGHREGRGTMTWALEGAAGLATYMGAWRASLRDGMGTMSWDVDTKEDGCEAVFEGIWKGGRRNGFGTMTYHDGAVYAGQFKDDVRDGHGRMVYAIGDVYDGMWRGDVPDGKGVISFVTGGKYSGKLANGQRHGRGTYRFANGDLYDGEYEHDVRAGRGTYTPVADGGIWTQLSYYRDDVQVGEGVEWSNEKKAAWVLRDGKRVEEIDLKKALSVVAKIGLTLKNPPRPSQQ